MNTVYRDLILARAQSAINAARAVTGIDHPGLKGQLREIVIRDLFQPLFPSDIGLGTGVIITAINQQSQEQDIVVFDKSIVPPILLEGTTGVFPIESVIYAIEIKSRLTAAELRSSIDSARQLDSLQYMTGEYDTADTPIESISLRLIPAILAFNSDLSESGMTELERFKEIWGGSTDEPPPIRMICVVGRGCWAWKPTLPNKWRTWGGSYELEEVIRFIAAVMNSYKLIALSRKEPRLGRYLF